MLALWQLNSDQIANLVPIAGIIMSLIVAVAIIIAVAHVKARKIEAERDMLARRLAYDQRLKELELERLKLAAGGTGAPAPPAGESALGAGR